MIATGLHCGYRFLAFDDPERHSSARVCLLRHDVDADMHAAARMAEIEAEIGVRSTYFLMVRSPLYNLFSRANQELASFIVQQGHFIGVHYDQAGAPKHLTGRESILFEAAMLARTLDVRISVVSFHQPGADVLRGEVDTGHLVNTYSKSDLHGFCYISDSNRQWRSHDPAKVFRDQEVARLHLLVHPMWWMHGDRRSTEEVWDAVLLGNFERAQTQLLATERAYGAKRRILVETDPDG